jgi:hypothetical protein
MPDLPGRFTMVVAAAGYGKTEAVCRWLGPVSAQWHDGTAPTEVEAAWTVVDNAAGLGRDDVGAILGRVRRSPNAGVVLVSRWPLALPVDSRRLGLVEERGPVDLALSVADVAGVLRREYGLGDADLAAAVHDLTGGWPALVRLSGVRLATSGEPMRPRDDLATVIGGPGTEVAAFLDKHVLMPLPKAAARLLRDVAHLESAQLEGTDKHLYRALGHRRPEPTLAMLGRIGVIVARPGPSSCRLVPLVGQVVRERWPLVSGDRTRLYGIAGDWYAANDRPGAAIEAYRLGGRSASCADLLRRNGPAWVNAGGASTIATAIEALPAADRCSEMRLLLGEALLVVGEDDRAISVLTTLAGGDDDLPAGLAWRLGAVYYQRGDPHSASTTFGRGRLGDESTADEAMLLAGSATARWMAGDPATAGDLARRALVAAERANDDRARSAAHVALAMHAMLAGDRPGNAAHYDVALRYAEAARDDVQAARIHNNHSARLLEEAHYLQALGQAREAGHWPRPPGARPSWPSPPATKPRRCIDWGISRTPPAATPTRCTSLSVDIHGRWPTR